MFRNPFMTVARHEAILDDTLIRSRQKGRLAAEALAERDRAYAKLREIAAMDTPKGSHASKKMAAVARDALPN